MAALAVVKGLKEKRTGAKSDQALRRILNFLDHNNNHKIRLEDFIDIMDEHNVEFDPEEVLELCELTEATGEICHSTLIIFIKNARVWKLLERQAPTESRSRIEAISAKANKVHAAFNLLDSDRDGFVTRSDFKKKFHNLNSKQIDVVFQRYDRSSHGRLSFVEFKNFMARRPLPLRLESRRASILSLSDYESNFGLQQPQADLPLHPPSYQDLSGLPAYQDAFQGSHCNSRDPPSYNSLPSQMQPPRYSSLGYTEEEKAEVAKQLLSLSHACSQSLEELTSLGVDIEEDIDVEEEEDGVNELSTISEEQGEL